jgi:hypothetical protein
MMWLLKAVGGIMVAVGFSTALLDMGMNGARYAAWAPWGLGMTVIGLILAGV